MELSGLHHLTAVTGDARANLLFYSRVLGLRLVKKTVNQDVISTYHLFYGDEVGSPGTEMTFFDWPNAGPHHSGSGDIAPVTFMVPDRAALEWWLRRFETEGVAHGSMEERAGRAVVPFTDPEGQRLELAAGGVNGASPWKASPVPADVSIHGLGAVTLVVRRSEATAHVLTSVMGFRPAGSYRLDGGASTAQIYETARGGLGTEVHIVERPDLPAASVGVGGVHHVAFRTPDDEEHAAWRQHLVHSGLQVTPVIDRYYFRSLYFREPGGALFEIATDGPGFTADEDVDHLGEHLSLPPFLEARRSEIERHLQPLELPPAPSTVSG